MEYNIYIIEHPLRNKDFYRHCGLPVEGWISIGLIDRNGDDPGALVIDSNGAYQQVNFRGEWIRPLDQQLVFDALGRAKRVSKSKPLKSIRLQAILMLDESSYEILLRIGGGFLSKGVRDAARHIDKITSNEWENSGEVWGLQRYTVSIDEQTKLTLKRIGFGNMSAGARRAAKLIKNNP